MPEKEKAGKKDGKLEKKGVLLKKEPKEVGEKKKKSIALTRKPLCVGRQKEKERGGGTPEGFCEPLGGKKEELPVRGSH